MKIFEAKEASLIVAATKYLDLLFLASNEQFNLWTWMFIKDLSHSQSVKGSEFIIWLVF